MGQLYYRATNRPNLQEKHEVEPEKEVEADKKGPYILQSEVEKAIKEITDKKATEDDDSLGMISN
jgi:hypothetical protein